MSSESTSDKLAFSKLGEKNYNTWSGDMMAKLMEKRCWKVTKSDSRPSDALEVEDWELRCGQAAGIIWSGLEDSMKEFVKDHLGDPAAMWKTLQTHHQQQKPTTRFVAYEALFGLQKREESSPRH